MIISTGMRTDIPAFYPKWLANRFKEGFVLVRNPYYPTQIIRYELNPEVVDCVAFCTKNPKPLFKYFDVFKDFHQFWFMTITPYGSDIEPNVLPVDEAIEAFKELSSRVGLNSISWRYDPIFYGRGFDRKRHAKCFEEMCKKLEGYTDTCVISFLEMYKKVEKNCPGIYPPDIEEQRILLEILGKTASKYGITIKTCMAKYDLPIPNIDMSGCQSKEVIERAIGDRLDIKEGKSQRRFCSCVLGRDIGEYNTCLHLCRYCYANNDPEQVKRNHAKHHDDSPLLIGEVGPKDKISQAKQTSNISKNISLF